MHFARKLWTSLVVQWLSTCQCRDIGPTPAGQVPTRHAGIQAHAPQLLRRSCSAARSCHSEKSRHGNQRVATTRESWHVATETQHSQTRNTETFPSKCPSQLRSVSFELYLETEFKAFIRNGKLSFFEVHSPNFKLCQFSILFLTYLR